MDYPFPIVKVEGTSFECGQMHGEKAKQKIMDNLEYYLGWWKRNLNLDKTQIFEYGSTILKVLEKFDERIFREILGVAEGSDIKPEFIAAINGRYELAWTKKEQLLGGCTSIASLSSSSKENKTLLAQNWDYRLPVKENCIILELNQDNENSIVMHTEAGVIGQKGFNSNGLGIVINAMVSDKDQLGNTIPFFIICRAMLNESRFDKAIQVLLRSTRSVSYNVMVAMRGGVAVDLEAHPYETSVILPDNDILVHTNHFIGERCLYLVDEFVKEEPSSIHRYLVAMNKMMGNKGNHSFETFTNVLTDHFGHPSSICYHPDSEKPADKREESLTSVIFDLDAGKFWFTKGPPCSNEYHLYVPEFS
jgi:isopenicillin-N N-acyltransferase-like protein